LTPNCIVNLQDSGVKHLRPSSTTNDGLEDQTSAANRVISPAYQQVQQLGVQWIKGYFVCLYGGYQLMQADLVVLL